MQLSKNVYKEYKKYPERIVQFGEGNFLRAFVDWIIDDMNDKANFNSSVVVVQPLAGGRIKELNDQDGLYTLYLSGIKNGQAVKEHKVINSISRGINPYENYEEYLAIGENPDLRFVISNTTEAGISYSAGDTIDKIQNSYPAKLTALMYHRYKTFDGAADKGLIIMPCELIDQNADHLKEFILQYAKEWNLEAGFINWIETANTFCNTLVDRIVPGYPRDKAAEYQKDLGYEDVNLVECEQFHLWVIEAPQWVKNEFPADKAGLNVLFTDNQKPYKVRKVRILNGAHTTLTPVAYLYGIDTVRESVEHEVMGKFLKDAIYNEIIPTLELPKAELEQFAKDVLERFSNPYVKHLLMSIALNSMPKYETRVLPSLLTYAKEKNTLPKKLVFGLAAMMVFYKGDRNGEKIDVADGADIIELYADAWKMYDGSKESVSKVVTKVLAYESNWKMDLNKVAELTDLVTQYVYAILTDGIQKAINAVM